MTMTLGLLFLASIVLDVCGQLFFKIGAERLPDFHGPDRRAFYRGLLADWWLGAGLVTYAGELVMWLRILSEAPISIAFPLASASFLGVALVSRFILKERVTQSAVARCGPSDVRSRVGGKQCLAEAGVEPAWSRKDNWRKKKKK